MQKKKKKGRFLPSDEVGCLRKAMEQFLMSSSLDTYQTGVEVRVGVGR